MIILDAHCDTLTQIIKRNENLFDNSCHIDIRRLLFNKAYHNCNNVQIFAAFCGKNPAEGEINIRIQITQLKKETSNYFKYIKLCKSSNDVLKAIENGKIAALLSVEGLNFISNSEKIEDNHFLKYLINNDVKMIAPSWNYSGNICCSCLDENDIGLSDYGRKLTKYLNKNSIIIDVSHMSDRSFDDVISITTKPIAASHSNCKSICNHSRNLSDDRIKAIAKNHGIICINFYQFFLKDAADITDYTDIGIDVVMKHIEYIASLVGVDYIGIGSDFDGIDLPASDLSDCSFVYMLIDKMHQLNYSNLNIEKIMGKNFLRVMKLNEIDIEK